MQSSSSMQFTPSMSVAAQSIVQQGGSESDLASSSKQFARVSSIAGLTTIFVLCIGCIFGLLVSVFAVDPGTENHLDCIDISVASETVQTMITFFMGWFCFFILNRRHKLPEYRDEALQAMHKLQSSMCAAGSSVASAISNIRPRLELSKGAAGIIMGAILCILSVTGLLVSAFAAVPDAEPSDDGVASESSTTMRYFTVTWIFCLSLKLLHELVGLVGWSCFFQPC
jgi:hypothetical protein